jgi:hypothetical protein
MYMIMFGMPGISTVSAITSIPTIVSFRYAPGVGAQSSRGAKLSQIPTKQQIQSETERSGRSARHPKTTSRIPLRTSLQVVREARSASCVSRENQTPRPPLGRTQRSGFR